MQHDPTFVSRHIEPNGDGTFTVTFYREQGTGFVKEPIIVDGRIPEVEGLEGGNWVLDRGAEPGESGDRWAQIYQKAYAKKLGGGDLTKGFQELLNGGYTADSLEHLTGFEARRVGSGDLDFAMLNEMLEQGPVTAASRGDVPSSGFAGFNKNSSGRYGANGNDYDGFLHTDHAYSVERVDGDIVTVYNPWRSRTEPIKMPIEDFLEAFPYVNGVDLAT